MSLQDSHHCGGFTSAQCTNDESTSRLRQQRNHPRSGIHPQLSAPAYLSACRTFCYTPRGLLASLACWERKMGGAVIPSQHMVCGWSLSRFLQPIVRASLSTTRIWPQYRCARKTGWSTCTCSVCPSCPTIFSSIRPRNSGAS